MRGNLPAAGMAAGGVGSIPAYAGEPFEPRVSRRFALVYPRVCGGTECTSRRAIRTWGLSPRMRGNRAVTTPDPAFLRSIPAYAGEPGIGAALRVGDQVYPRVCGGTAGTYRRPANVHGLSPRMRGNPRAASAVGCGVGSIPAYAGEP